MRSPLLLAGALLALGCTCAREPAAPPRPAGDAAAAPAPPIGDVAAERFRARALYESGRQEEAAAVFARLAEGPAADPRDRLGQALALSELGRADETLAAVAAAREAGQSSPALAYVAGQAHRARRDLAAAEKELAAAVAQAPDAPEAAYWLGVTRQEAGDLEGALEGLSALAEQGQSAGTVHPLPALYRTGRIQLQLGREAEGVATVQRYQERFGALGRPSLAREALFHGRLTVLDIPPPPPAAAGHVTPRLEVVAATEPGAGAPVVAWLDGQGKPPTILWPRGNEVRAWKPGGDAPRTLWAPTGAAPVIRALAAGDLDGDTDTDLYLARIGVDAILVATPAGWHPAPMGAAERSDAVLLQDQDHDGDLDVIVARADGPTRLHRAIGPTNGLLPVKFESAGADRGLEAPGPRTGGLFLDADDDGAIDLLLWGYGPLALLRNPWKGPFADVTAAAGLTGAAGTQAGVAEDFDGDGRFDLALVRDGTLALWRNAGGGRFAAPRALGPSGRALAAGDLDNDGRLDLVHPTPDGALEALLWRGPERFDPLPLHAGPIRGAPTLADLDRDGRLDVVVGTAKGPIALLNRTDGLGAALSLELEGRNSNAGGVGASVEIQAGPLYVRRRAAGVPLRLGLGPAKKADVVRVRWPTGAYQALLDVAAGDVPVPEPSGLTGSCPFLYVWNGERFLFYGDFLGQAPIGIPIGDGMVTPDADEPLILRGEDLRLKDGRLVLQMKEEFREVTYLDAVKLFALDRPATSFVSADGRCKAPPFPERDLYASATVRPPRAARDQDGRDVLPLLLERDSRPVHAFEATDVAGVVTPHALELDLGPLGPRDRPILYLDGWTYWAGSNTEAALAQDPGRRSEPPRLEVPDGRGGWRVAIADLGFPAGTTNRAIPVVLEGLLRAGDPRVRIVTNLQIYWDRARVAIDGGDLPVRRTPLPILRADLHYRGVATAVRTGGDAESPELWDYDRIVPRLAARWGQIPGRHTPDGDVRALLAEPDDRVATLDAGDEITVEIGVADLPPPPEGYTRDYLMLSWGWDKDGNFHTAAGQAVGPLPFRAMAIYPFGLEVEHPDPAFEDTLTRPARATLPDLRLEALSAATRAR